MILRVDDKDIVRERHSDGTAITGTNVLTQKYWDPYDATPQEKDYLAATGKEILCYVVVSTTGAAGTSSDFKIWANTTKDSKTSGRDVFGGNFTVTVNSVFKTVPAFILKAGEYLNIERVSGTSNNVFATTIVGVERDET